MTDVPDYIAGARDLLAATPTHPMTEEQRDDLIDLLPADMTIWDGDDEAEGYFADRDWPWWREALGHPTAHRGCCRTCGCATTCTLAAFHDAVVASVVRELDRIGALRQPPAVDTEKIGETR